MGGESKQIGQYTCFKATASIPTSELTWYDFSWNDLRQPSSSDVATAEGGEPQLEQRSVDPQPHLGIDRDANGLQHGTTTTTSTVTTTTRTAARQL